MEELAIHQNAETGRHGERTMEDLSIHENAEPGRHGVQEITAYFREGVERNGKNSLWARRAMPSSPARIQGKHRFRARASRTDLLPIFPSAFLANHQGPVLNKTSNSSSF